MFRDVSVGPSEEYRAGPTTTTRIAERFRIMTAADTSDSLARTRRTVAS